MNRCICLLLFLLTPIVTLAPPTGNCAVPKLRRLPGAKLFSFPAVSLAHGQGIHFTFAEAPDCGLASGRDPGDPSAPNARKLFIFGGRADSSDKVFLGAFPIDTNWATHPTQNVDWSPRLEEPFASDDRLSVVAVVCRVGDPESADLSALSAVSSVRMTGSVQIFDVQSGRMADALPTVQSMNPAVLHFAGVR